jgi:hypothetical protein
MNFCWLEDNTFSFLKINKDMNIIYFDWIHNTKNESNFFISENKGIRLYKV